MSQMLGKHTLGVSARVFTDIIGMWVSNLIGRDTPWMWSAPSNSVQSQIKGRCLPAYLRIKPRIFNHLPGYSLSNYYCHHPKGPAFSALPCPLTPVISREIPGLQLQTELHHPSLCSVASRLLHWTTTGFSGSLAFKSQPPNVWDNLLNLILLSNEWFIGSMPLADSE